jgi:hypothetical protein
MRRLRVVRRTGTWLQEPAASPFWISTTDMPCEAIAICLTVASSYSPVGNISTSSVYSWLHTSSARLRPSGSTPT